MSKFKQEQIKKTIASAFEDGKAEISSLAEEMREWAENMEGAGTGLENTQKYSDVDDAASQLEAANDNLESSEIPPNLEAKEITVTEFKDVKARWRRCSNAVANLQAIIDFIDESKQEEWQDISSELQNAIDEAEGVDFPGMY